MPDRAVDHEDAAPTKMTRQGEKSALGDSQVAGGGTGAVSAPPLGTSGGPPLGRWGSVAVLRVVVGWLGVLVGFDWICWVEVDGSGELYTRKRVYPPRTHVPAMHTAFNSQTGVGLGPYKDEK